MISFKNCTELVKVCTNEELFIKIFKDNNEYKKLLKDKCIFEDGAVNYEYFKKIISGCSLKSYFIDRRDFAGTFIDSEYLKINKESDYLFLYNDEMSLMIPAVKYEDNHKEAYKIYANELIHVSDFLLDKCDTCSCVAIKDLLYNLYPEINTGLAEKYADFRGRVCSLCLDKMENGESLPNEEVNNNKTSKDVNEKIDEFSSLEDILKFCGMDNKEEMEKALMKKIYDRSIQ